MLAALVIIPAMAVGVSGADGNVLEQGGPGLMFIALPKLFKSMPGGTVFAVVFFVAVMFAGLSSLINLYEAPIATLQEKFRIGRLPSVAIIGGTGLVVSLCIQGIVSGWMDIVSIFICPLGAGLAGVMFFWVAGKGFVENAVNSGLEKPVGAWFYPLAKYGFCGLCGLVLIVGAISYVVLGSGIG
jgi:NSS family neurotransmitter:Na+ symporter